MDNYEQESEHRKKRRRREITPQPIQARLTFDDGIKGDAALLSPSLYRSLHDGWIGEEKVRNGSVSSQIYVAFAPVTPLHSSLEDSVWTITPANTDADQNHLDDTSNTTYWAKLSIKSTAVASLLNAYIALDHNRHGGHIPKSIDIRIVAASPIALESVYVTVEKGLLEKVDDIQSKFGGGFHQSKSKKPALDQGIQNHQDRLKAVVRDGLARVPVVHSGDVFQLPLPPHPITHARPPPAIAIHCEPVSQGLVTPTTRIVLIQAGSSQEKAVQKLTPAQPIIEESLEDTAEDTSNDQFFSAAEDKELTTSSEAEGEEDESTTEDSDHGGSDDDSDSMEDMISLSAPGLPPQQAGTLSAMTSATPRPGDKRGTGMNTPGSIYSSFSASTARAGSRPGKVFRTEALLRKMPGELLHPKPGAEDDEEAMVFVDTSALGKIGCFSGDWVRIELSKNVSLNGFPTSGFNALRGLPGDEESDWRAVRIFGLSGLGEQKTRYAVDKTGDRRSSFSGRDSYPSMTPRIYLSPVLLANLSNTQFVKVGALPRPGRYDVKQRPPTSKNPPFAREVSLLKISTPMTTRKDLQTALFAGLKRFFETRKRALKKGDLIAISIDQDLGSLLAPAGSNESDSVSEELQAVARFSRRGQTHSESIAWFKVQNVEAETEAEVDDPPNDTPWGGVALVDHLNVRLHTQAGTSHHVVSDAIDLWTRYWLGLKQISRQSGYRSEIIATPAALPELARSELESRLHKLIAAATSPRAISLGMPPLAILIHSTQRQVGKLFTSQSACSSAGIHTMTVSGYDLLAENGSTSGGGDVKTEATLKARAEIALACGPQQTAIIIQNIDTLTAARMEQTLRDIINDSRVLIATTSKIDDIPAGVRSLFTHEFEITAPNENSREAILSNACISSSLLLSPAINLKNIALQTAALVAGDLLDVVDRASLARLRRLAEMALAQSCSISDIIVAGGQATTHLMPSDFTAAIAAARATFSDAIGAPKIPTVTWDDVGGLASQKDAIMETISLPLTHPELFANGVRKRSGILFYGPPGTGKTLLAKAIATEFSLNFFSVKGPELLNMYIGESEANVRRVFQRARDARPCVVFFDELDSVAPKRGNQGDSGGVMDRIVSQLLAELDGMSTSPADDSDNSTPSSGGGSGVFVIGATNRPDLLDPALLRPGRFDKMLYLGVADSHDQQVTILQALTRKFTLHPTVDLHRVASKLPYTYTGADLYALCSDAMLKAITRKTEAVDVKVAKICKERGEEISTGYFFDHLATDEDTQVTVNEEDFAKAQEELVGSVSRKELDHFERIRGLFEEQDISAADKKKQQSTTQQFLPLRQAPVPGLKAPTSPTSRQDHFSTPPPHQQPHPLSPSSATSLKQPPWSPRQHFTTPTSQDPNPDANAKGKGKLPLRPSTAQRFQRIGNPDSGEDSSQSEGMRMLDPAAEEADYSAAGESDFGVSSRHLNGSSNGDIRGKGKGRAVVEDGFVHDSIGEDDDEGLYDDID